MYANPEIGALLRELSVRLEVVSESPRLDAELLLSRAIDMPRSYLFSHPEDSLDEIAIERLARTVSRRLDGEPMAYITGTREFWSMELVVSPATLVPRPETEVLVDHALREIPRKAEWRILDLGTGSGAIALALASERPLCTVTATDISADALGVATENARRMALPNVEFLHGDWTAPLAGRRSALIATNPPYVEANDQCLEALKSEPRVALAAGDDGLDAIRTLARDCPALLEDGGLFLIEHGATQTAAVGAILEQNAWRDRVYHNDYSGLPRLTTARNRRAASKHGT